MIERRFRYRLAPGELAHGVLGDIGSQELAMQVNANIARKATATPIPTGNAKNRQDLERYFEYSQSGVDVVEDGLKEISFGEYLVEERVLDRYQLFRALQMQDRLPGVRLGEAAAALGYAPITAIEKIYERFTKLHTVDVE
jgi:hypothetical protein